MFMTCVTNDGPGWTGALPWAACVPPEALPVPLPDAPAEGLEWSDEAMREAEFPERVPPPFPVLDGWSGPACA
jgi:hypothetical protein